MSSVFVIKIMHAGGKIVAGAADGSVHIWLVKKVYSRPDYVVRGHSVETSVISVLVAADNCTLATRGMHDKKICVWDIAKPSTNAKPLLELTNVPNDYATANVEFR